MTDQPHDNEARVEWRCFHCGDVFTDESCARLHFGRDEDSTPACQIKAGAEQGLLGALRAAEYEASDARRAIADECTEAARAHYAQASRHDRALRNAEEAGYERGLADGLSTPAPAAQDGREAVGERIYRAMYEHKGGRWECVETRDVWYEIADRFAAVARSDSARVDIPAGMVPWHGGDSAPADWDGGPALFRDGTLSNLGRDGWDWKHVVSDPSCVRAVEIIAYTPKPTASGGGEREALQAIKNAARYVPVGDGYFDFYASHVEAVDAAVDRLATTLAQPATREDACRASSSRED